MAFSGLVVLLEVMRILETWEITRRRQSAYPSRRIQRAKNQRANRKTGATRGNEGEFLVRSCIECDRPELACRQPGLAARGAMQEGTGSKLDWSKTLRGTSFRQRRREQAGHER